MDDVFYKSFLDKTFEPTGRPLDYPVPNKEKMLFFIQRNANLNTVVYEINVNNEDQILLNEPMKVYWIGYDQFQEESQLNYIQNKFAYGYNHKLINNDLIEFEFVSYKKTFFIHKIGNVDFKVVTKINNEYAYLTNIYVYAEEFGVFPDVQFVEFYGLNVEDKLPVYEKIVL